jgi:hypothetical protein
VTALLVYPFQLTPAGNAATVEDGSDEQLAMELAVGILTVRGERALVPDFGCDDPVFLGFDEDALRLHVGLFGPPVDIDEVDLAYPTDRTQEVVVRFNNDGGDS